VEKDFCRGEQTIFSLACDIVTYGMEYYALWAVESKIILCLPRADDLGPASDPKLGPEFFQCLNLERFGEYSICAASSEMVDVLG
jgi:hypothetical protein